MVDHIGLEVSDLKKSVAFYKAALEPLGFVLCSESEGSAGFGPKDAPALWLNVVKKARGGAHVAFTAKSRQAVDGFHAGALAAGGKDNGKPGVRADYAPTYYAAFLHDPDGNNVEAVCLT